MAFIVHNTVHTLPDNVITSCVKILLICFLRSYYRKIKNVETGVDISVPSHQTADSPRNVKDYHVIVISNLPHFKLPQHDEDDTVQFMVN